MVESIQNGTYTWESPWTSTVTPKEGGGDYEAALSFDFQGANTEALVNEVAPGADAQVPGLGDTAFLEQDFTAFTIDFTVPDGVTVQGTPTVTGTGAGEGATVTTSAGKVSVTLPTISVGSYNPGATVTPQRPSVAPFIVTLTADLGSAETPAPLEPTDNTFGLTYVTGITLGETLSGGANATQTCVLSATATPTEPGGTPAGGAPADGGDPAAAAAAAAAAPTAAAAVTPSGTLPYTGIRHGHDLPSRDPGRCSCSTWAGSA